MNSKQEIQMNVPSFLRFYPDFTGYRRKTTTNSITNINIGILSSHFILKKSQNIF